MCLWAPNPPDFSLLQAPAPQQVPVQAPARGSHKPTSMGAALRLSSPPPSTREGFGQPLSPPHAQHWPLPHPAGWQIKAGMLQRLLSKTRSAERNVTHSYHAAARATLFASLSRFLLLPYWLLSRVSKQRAADMTCVIHGALKPSHFSISSRVTVSSASSGTFLRTRR